MRIIVLGAGNVARALLDALHEEHDVTVIDSDPQRLAQFAGRYDVRTVEGDGTTEQVIRKAGADGADLFIGCSPREEANLVGAMLAKRLSRAPIRSLPSVIASTPAPNANVAAPETRNGHAASP